MWVSQDEEQMGQMGDDIDDVINRTEGWDMSEDWTDPKGRTGVRVDADKSEDLWGAQQTRWEMGSARTTGEISNIEILYLDYLTSVARFIGLSGLSKDNLDEWFVRIRLVEALGLGPEVYRKGSDGCWINEFFSDEELWHGLNRWVGVRVYVEDVDGWMWRSHIVGLWQGVVTKGWE